MKWHKYPDEVPRNTCSGGYLILNHFGEIAEAEFRGDGWFQYRWSTYLHGDAVVAWCSLSDVDRPDFCKAKENE